MLCRKGSPRFAKEAATGRFLRNSFRRHLSRNAMQVASISRAALAVLCLFSTSALRAEPSPQERVATVLADMARRDAQPFQPYAVHVEEEANGRKLSFDVRAPSEYVRQNTLLTSNGKAATPEEAANFAKERDSSEAPKPAKGSIRIERLADLIDPGSLVFEKMDGTKALFTFTHVQPFSEDVSVKLGGRLAFDTAQGVVTHLELFNTAPFKPDPKAKVRTFTFALDFATIDGTDHVVPTAIHTHVEGRALLVFSFDENAEVLFTGYRKLEGKES